MLQRFWWRNIERWCLSTAKFEHTRMQNLHRIITHLMRQVNFGYSRLCGRTFGDQLKPQCGSIFSQSHLCVCFCVIHRSEFILLENKSTSSLTLTKWYSQNQKQSLSEVSDNTFGQWILKTWEKWNQNDVLGTRDSSHYGPKIVIHRSKENLFLLASSLAEHISPLSSSTSLLAYELLGHD